MKRFAVILWLVFWGTLAWAQDPGGREIMDIQRDRHRIAGVRDHVVMLLVDKSGGRTVRELVRYGKTRENGLRLSLLTFTAPADLKGTALLTREVEEGTYKQWLHLPGHTSLQRIASKAKRTAFMGSDFTYEDMQPDKLDNYLFSDPKTETVDGHDCYVVDITPATKDVRKGSSYAMRRVWVRKDIFFTVKIEFFDRRKRLVKRQTNHSLKPAGGDAWYAEKVLMENLEKNHKTLMGLKDRQIGIDLDDALFTEKTILSGKHF